MTLIEGIGDEVTILVTVIVAVTTIVAAWFSTSVTEHQHPYWQDDSGSVVDPEPPSQESTYSEDGIRDVRSEAVNDTTSERVLSENANEEPSHASGSDPLERNFESPHTAADIIEQIVSVEELDACPHQIEEGVLNPGTPQGNKEATKQSSASQSSSFECIEATNSESNESVILKSSEHHGNDDADGVSSYEHPPMDVIQERVEDVQMPAEEQCVRRRHVPSSEAASSVSAQSAEPPTKEDQSETTSQTETKTCGQSERVSQAEATRDSQSQRTRDQAASGVITIKLRFLDETERIVSTNIADTLGNFRRETFASEIQEGQMVRLISNGHLLSEDSRTLASYGITNQQVIHCQISRVAPRDQRGDQTSDASEGEFDLGRYMVPLFACILAFMWYLRFQYRYMFNATSTLSLTAVTAVFVLALLAVWRS